MRIIKDPLEFIGWRRTLGEKSIGFVPTMGALHIGHEALMARARAGHEIAILSIFVNPTQFNDKTDLLNYPKTWEADVAIAEKHGFDAIFCPDYGAIYPDNYRYIISENEVSKILCGASRPGHFDGVLTIVMKLLNIVKATRAYFGEKDFQQLTLIKGMTQAFFMETEIVPIPIVREKDGLAFSSRNVHLSEKGRAIAPILFKAISTASSLEMARSMVVNAGFEIDYLKEEFGRRLIAVYTKETKNGKVLRLIDNVKI